MVEARLRLNRDLILMKRIRLTFCTMVLLLLTGQAVSALTYELGLYRPEKIAERGIRIAVQELKSGVLECTLSFDEKKVGSAITSLELSSTTDHATVDVELQLREWKGKMLTRFKLSRELLLHGRIRFGVADSVPGGTFISVAFMDMIDFEQKLPPLLQRRLERLIAMKLVDDPETSEAEIQKRIESYTNTRPEGKPLDPRKLGDLLLKPMPKTRILPFKEK